MFCHRILTNSEVEWKIGIQLLLKFSVNFKLGTSTSQVVKPICFIRHFCTWLSRSADLMMWSLFNGHCAFLMVCCKNFEILIGNYSDASLKLRLHAEICRARFVFWRMKNTADAIIRLRSHYTVIWNATLSCVFARLHMPDGGIVPDKS
jgi:hypothetical protein